MGTSSTRIVVCAAILAWLASRWQHGGPLVQQPNEQIGPAHASEPSHCPHHLYTYSLFTESAHLSPSSLRPKHGAPASAAPAAPAPLLLELVFSLQDAARHMPVLGANMGRGIEHSLLKTATLLKYLALLNDKLEALQCNAADGNAMKPLSQWRFAVPHTAIQWAAADARAAASNASSSDALAASVASVLSRAQCDDSRLFRRAPPSTLLTIPGNSVAGVADILRVRLLPVPSSSPGGAAAAAGSFRVVLTLSVVADPRTINEFEPHPMHALGDEDHAHYHFFTSPGTEVNATKLLTQLLGSADPRDWSEGTTATLPELHLFIKGVGHCRNVTGILLPGTDVSDCFDITDPGNSDIWTFNGENCTTSCLAGFQPAPTPPVIMCWALNSSATTPYNWTLVSGACAAPSPLGCISDPSTTPQHSTWPAGGCLGGNGSVPDGTRCFATCNTGYTGSPYYTCNTSSWYPGPTGCLPNPCPGNPTATAPAGSSWPASGCGQFGQPAQSGSSCTAPCNSGFSPSPTGPTSVCSLGSWSTVSGACSPNPCLSLPTASVPGGGTWPAACIRGVLN